MPGKQVVIIDTREQWQIKSIIQAALNEPLIPAALPEGDFMLPDQDTHVMLIERKTVGDFINSLRDGRLSTQFERLKSHPMVGLIVEGRYAVSGEGTILLENHSTRWSHASFQMALWSLQRNVPGLVVWWSNGLGETADIIRAIANRGRNGCYLDSTLFDAGHDRQHRTGARAPGAGSNGHQRPDVKAPGAGGKRPVARRKGAGS